MNTDQALATVNRLYARLASRRPEIDRFERYFRGEQPLAYASDAWSKEYAKRYAGFSDNWCAVVGPAAAERTELIGFRIGDDLDTLSADEQVLWRDWELNQMPLQSTQGFHTSSIARRSAVIVWGDEQSEPTASWEHPGQVIVDYDPGNRLRRRYALKAWQEGDDEYATLYTPTELWKFTRKAVQASVTAQGGTQSGLWVPSSFSGASAGGWEARTGADTGDDTWPLPNPLGELPVVEFEHKPQLVGEPLSRIAGTVAMQDAINLLWAYLFVAADYASMPARVVMGQEPPKLPILDANGQKIGEKPVDIGELSRGRMLWLTGQNAKIDSWDAAKLDVFTEVINVAVKHTASQTKTPIHYIVGDLGNVNGETLTATETPLVADVRNDQLAYTSPMREVFRLMALVRGDGAVAEACRTGVPGWKNPGTRSEAQLADAALKDRQQGFPLEWIARERYGMGQQEVARLMEMVDRDPMAGGLLARTMRSLGTGDEPNAA